MKQQMVTFRHTFFFGGYDYQGWIAVRSVESVVSAEFKTVLVEPTTGNTGLGLAFVAATKGYKLIVTMPASVNIERRILLRTFGAEVILTNAEKGLKGAVDKAEEIVNATPNAYMFRQFDNKNNTKIHFETTGPEIWEDTMGSVDVLVAAIGTGGTITGTGDYLKLMNKNIQVVGVEPADRSIISGDNPVIDLTVLGKMEIPYCIFVVYWIFLISDNVKH
ncbi:unnamed protein product [Trifolium pratense]|uniref:Uncharacterized protein n=1 Tax=Trifolium pratense TaxID=57577 RepID=A0ACB0KP53_TRIPR|nr:unnamed protein product [Trifolium pratense]